MSTTTDPLRLCSVSDIHLYHRRTGTKFIIDNLNRYLSNDEVMSGLDLMIVAGDLFDNALSLASIDVYDIEQWISRLLRLCVRHNVCLRVLEGTPSHDRKQSASFVRLNDILRESTGIAADLKYQDTLTIEHIERFGINVLYVPDEWHHDTADTLIEVKELLKAHGLQQVDHAVMHGMFDYQAPEISKPHLKHDSAEYLALVSGLIFIGHYHTPSSHERIYAQGSFDRLCHNEEHPKGYYQAQYWSPVNYRVSFIENKTAKAYVTIDVKGGELEDDLKRIGKRVVKLADGSHVRLIARSSDPLSQAIETVKRMWPQHTWSVQLKDDKQDKKIEYDEEVFYPPITINPSTIEKLVSDRFNPSKLNGAQRELALMRLREAL